jgi:hypothetical protein
MLRGPVALLAVLVGATIVGLTLFVNDWWVAALVGFILATLARGPRVPLMAAAAGLLGWGVPLAVMATHAPVGAAATGIGAILGAPDPVRGAVAVVATLAIGVLLAVAGSWVGASLRRLMEA